jgi:hypothetical protein
VLYSPGAGTNLQAFFNYHQVPSLGKRVLIAPYPLDTAFVNAPMPAKRENQVVAIGRWDAPQKDARLLSRVIARYLRDGGSWKFVLIGSNGETLVRGCSVIGPDSIPSFSQFCRDGCGTPFTVRTPQVVVTALTDEIQAWDAGRRDSTCIARRWKEHFTPEAICRSILDGQSCGSRRADVVHA